MVGAARWDEAADHIRTTTGDRLNGLDEHATGRPERDAGLKCALGVEGAQVRTVSLNVIVGAHGGAVQVPRLEDAHGHVSQLSALHGGEGGLPACTDGPEDPDEAAEEVGLAHARLERLVCGKARKGSFGPMRTPVVRVFLFTYLVVAIPVFVAVLVMDRFALHQAANAFHTPLADTIFRHGTHLGDTWVPIVVALLFLLKDWRSFLMVGLAAALSAIVAQLIKHLVFPDADRPTLFLDRMPVLPLVPGVEFLQHNSFPSGHSTAAFSVCLALAVIYRRPWVALGSALVAVFIACSRVYLSQHFAEDVLAGSFIGTATALLLHQWLYLGPFSEKPWLNRSPLTR